MPPHVKSARQKILIKSVARRVIERLLLPDFEYSAATELNLARSGFDFGSK